MLWRELQGVREIVVENLGELCGIGHDGPQAAIDVDPDLDTFLGGERVQDIARFTDDPSQLDRLRPELHLARLHLREVQDVVDELQQVARAGQDVPKVFLVLGRDGADLAVVHELGEADDAVERRPQLVGHVGQELALCTVGAIRLRFGYAPLTNLLLELPVHGSQLARSLLHPLFEFLRLLLDPLVESRLRDRDGQLGGRFLRDADLLGWELSGRSAEAQPADELAPRNHGHHHVHVDARGEQGLRVGAPG